MLHAHHHVGRVLWCAPKFHVLSQPAHPLYEVAETLNLSVFEENSGHFRASQKVQEGPERSKGPERSQGQGAIWDWPWSFAARKV